MNNYPPGYDGSLDGGLPEPKQSFRQEDEEMFGDSIFDELPTWAQSVQKRKQIARKKAMRRWGLITLYSLIITTIIYVWIK